MVFSFKKLFKKLFKRSGKGRLLANHTFGGFNVNVFFDNTEPKNCYATLDTESGIYHVKVGLTNPGYGYILKCVEAQDWPSVEAWAYCNYTVSSFLGSEQSFANDIIGAINANAERLGELASERAVEVTDRDELVAEAEMREAIEYSTMNKKEREVRKDEMRKEIRELLDEMDAADAVSEPGAVETAAKAGSEKMPSKPKAAPKPKATSKPKPKATRKPKSKEK